MNTQLGTTNIIVLTKLDEEEGAFHQHAIRFRSDQRRLALGQLYLLAMRLKICFSSWEVARAKAWILKTTEDS